MSAELHKAFRQGAEILAHRTYGDYHFELGINEQDWKLITQPQLWSPQEATLVRSILAQCLEATLAVSGIPATTLPAQYAAATIAIIVAPANRMVACLKAPDTFDAVAASGLTQDIEIRPAERETLMALVMAYSGGYGAEPMPRLDVEIREQRKVEQNA